MNPPLTGPGSPQANANQMVAKRIRDRRLELGLTQQQVADLAKTDQSQIQRLENGKRRITRDWAVALSAALKLSPEELLFGANTTNHQSVIDSPVSLAVTFVPVRGETAAGRWMEQDYVAFDTPEMAPVVPGAYAAADQFAFRVVGNSMDLERIFDGWYVVCVPYWIARVAPADQDVVVVERRRGSMIERTCKQIKLTATTIELWPRSTDPKHQTPIVVPRSEDMTESDGTTIEIVGLVIGRYGKM